MCACECASWTIGDSVQCGSTVDAPLVKGFGLAIGQPVYNGQPLYKRTKITFRCIVHYPRGGMTHGHRNVNFSAWHALQD